jgi:hypothetical protein
MKSFYIVPLLGSLLMIGCAATPVNSAAQKVMVVNSEQKIPSGCQYLGQVTGKQGNFFTGTYTSNANLAAGAMADLRNQASDIGGNYVQLLTNQASTTGSGGLLGGGMQQTGVVNIGNVYHCTESALSS